MKKWLALCALSFSCLSPLAADASSYQVEGEVMSEQADGSLFVSVTIKKDSELLAHPLFILREETPSVITYEDEENTQIIHIEATLTKDENGKKASFSAKVEEMGKQVFAVKEKAFTMPRIGLEPTHLTAPEPKSGVSTNFTTWAAANE